ncbi:Uncharacterised protein [Yersinia rohdei]|uniref:hypothetical protein n=1 Tax=Yersinia rohdei TaxID=29485 RepID=UPI0005DF8298|nr:hypothetical protein [Yersinia rohdei]CNF39512.1 Uncharacterised protein [Yersinia rohdei]CNI52969.1 Uncharacterised protein [Yersinia rohdei]
MAGWGSSNNDHWSAPSFDNYGFRRSELKGLAEKLGVDLDTPLDNIKAHAIKSKEPVLVGEDINKLKVEISELKEQIKKLNTERPLFLGVHINIDPLMMAIQLRNVEWQKYDEDDRSTTPSAIYLIEKLKQEHGMSDALARAIEKVACPIQRK